MDINILILSPVISPILPKSNLSFPWFGYALSKDYRRLTQIWDIILHKIEYIIQNKSKLFECCSKWLTSESEYELNFSGSLVIQFWFCENQNLSLTSVKLNSCHVMK